MAYLAKLEWGSRKLDLNDGTFSLGNDFVPPSTDYNLNIAEGTSANINAGGEVVGMRALDRDWSFPVRILGASDVETHMAARQLRAFLALAHDNRNTLYFCYKPNDDYDFEPLWGQHGSYIRYEVKHADAPIGQQYSQGSSASPIYTRALIVNVNMLISPYALGKKQRLGSATGFVLEDTIGTVDGFSRGVIVGGAQDNLVSNPIFGHGTWNNNWSVSNAALKATENTDERFVLFGTSSTKLVNTDAGTDRSWRVSVTTAGAASICQGMCYVKKEDESAITTADCQLTYGGSNQTTTFTNRGDGWYEATADITGVDPAAAANFGILVKSTMAVYADGFQFIESLTYPVPFRHGDMLGVTWSSTAHDSNSDATGGRIRVAMANIFDNMEGTIRVVAKMNNINTDYATDKYIFETDHTNQMGLFSMTNLRWIGRSQMAQTRLHRRAMGRSPGEILSYSTVPIRQPTGLCFTRMARLSPPTAPTHHRLIILTCILVTTLMVLTDQNVRSWASPLSAKR
jgi:hypothetical protein